MRWEQQVRYASLSDIGFRRRNNQDSTTVHICADSETWQRYGHLFLVADGMGGHAVGELASKIAADTVQHSYFKQKAPDVAIALTNSIQAANAAIHERGSLNHEFQRMGTTCCTLLLTSRGAVIGHVGDSRVYRIRGDRIDQLTFDHSLQWELIRRGHRKPEEVFLYEPRHVITRSLGPEPAVEVDIEGPHIIFPGDTFLLCSDGLTAHVNDAEIGAIAGVLPPSEACHLLVTLANLRGGSDNITVVIVRVGELPEGLEAQTDEVEPVDNQRGLNWWWLMGFWTVAVMLVFGISLKVLNLGGFFTAALTLAASTLAAGGLLLRWMRMRRTSVKTVDDNKNRTLSDTMLNKSYRTEQASLSREFLVHLAAVESELQRTAVEEGWSIEWPEHEIAYREAKNLLADGHQERSLRAMAKAIEVLMVGLHQHRKEAVRGKKWGKPPQPSDQPGKSESS